MVLLMRIQNSGMFSKQTFEEAFERYLIIIAYEDDLEILKMKEREEYIVKYH
jgi:hypothetical protein